jgi:hypothetical protein
MSGGGGAGFAGNILAGGLIGMGVDATSGAMNDLMPNPLHVDLLPVAPVVAVAAPAEAVATPAAATNTPAAAPATTDAAVAAPSSPQN